MAAKGGLQDISEFLRHKKHFKPSEATPHIPAWGEKKGGQGVRLALEEGVGWVRLALEKGVGWIRLALEKRGGLG